MTSAFSPPDNTSFSIANTGSIKKSASYSEKDPNTDSETPVEPIDKLIWLISYATSVVEDPRNSEIVSLFL